MSGQAEIPLLGLRVNGLVEGTISGPALQATYSGTDYAVLQRDGTIKVHVHGVITTHDGARISVDSEGIGRPVGTSGVFEGRQMQTLFTAEPAYVWVNDRRFFAVGEYNAATGEIVLDCYAQAIELATS